MTFTSPSIRERDRLRDLRAELIRRGIKQRELADRLHVSRQHVNALLHGRREITRNGAKLISWATGIPLKMIRDGEDE